MFKNSFCQIKRAYQFKLYFRQNNAMELTERLTNYCDIRYHRLRKECLAQVTNLTKRLRQDRHITLVCLFCYRSIVGQSRGDEQLRVQQS
jgi:hypothetical protein